MGGKRKYPDYPKNVHLGVHPFHPQRCHCILLFTCEMFPFR